jgi:hypothetical protein
MELTLKNYNTTLPQPLLKKAEKDVVRELDELDKGHYQAYVDEKGCDSFDVSLHIDSKGNVTKHTCDCKVHPDFCHHNAAVLIAIAKHKKVAPQTKKLKKGNTLNNLLDNLDADRLRVWVKDLLSKNKDIEIAFIHQFSEGEKIRTPETIMQQTQDAVKAVIRNKKTVEVSEIKRILDLWSELHTPIVAAYCANVADEAAFLNFHAVIEAWEALQSRLKTTSSRFNKYIDGLLAKVAAPIHGLHSEELWDRATGYFAGHLWYSAGFVRPYYLSFLAAIPVADDTDRKTRIAGLLIDQYGKRDLMQVYNADIYTELIFKIAIENGLFNKYWHLFKPGYFRNEYNEQLIRRLIKNGQLQLAEQYCREQIRRNYKQEYNALYLQLLKEVITINN